MKLVPSRLHRNILGFEYEELFIGLGVDDTHLGDDEDVVRDTRSRRGVGIGDVYDSKLLRNFYLIQPQGTGGAVVVVSRRIIHLRKEWQRERNTQSKEGKGAKHNYVKSEELKMKGKEVQRGSFFWNLPNLNVANTYAMILR